MSEGGGPPTTRMIAAAPVGRRLQLVTFGRGGSVTFAIPPSGEVRIGRALDCDVQIDEDSVSRHHAVLSATGTHVTLVDLGSANGTIVGGHFLAPGDSIDVPLGAVLSFGAVAAVVQAAPGSMQLRMVRTHDYFVTRVEEECVRAAASGATFAVISVRADERGGRIIEDILSKQLRRMDVTAMYAPHQFENLLVDIGADGARAIANAIEEASEATGTAAAVGLSIFPTDARTAHDLIAQSREGAQSSDRISVPDLTPRGFVPTIGVLERLRPLVERIASSDISVLVLGETGVGKELLSRMVHDLSPRKDRPLVSLNCAALDETLLESELFGHERGAFTGAVQAKQGILETAEGGTVFLDEVGEMPLGVQAKLLRVLETREVTRVGGLRSKAIDVRFVAATNRDLEAESGRGAFRQDLYFRLNGIALVLPPLRDRVGEIDQLVVVLVQQACAKARRAKPPRVVGSSRVDLQACKLEYSIVSPK